MVLSSTAENVCVQQCSAERLIGALRAAATWLSLHRERINGLNVFPVPDGDTGDNMLMTLHGGIKTIETLTNPSIRDVCEALEEGTLNSSRGNSGVILSQMIAGFTTELIEAEAITLPLLANAFQKAADEGYRAHSEPVEGTMMTVAKDIASKASETIAETSERGLNLNAFIDALVDEARKSVERTRTTLPRLQQANVVDAGGEGVAIILDGVRRFLNGMPMDANSMESFQEGQNLASYDVHEEDVYGYCTNFIVRGTNLNLAAFQEEVRSLGRSALVVGNSSHIKVHVHTEQPGDLLSYALSQGTLHEIKLDNMDDQVGGLHREANAQHEPETLTTALVAVVSGDGLARLLENDARAIIVRGGQSMNPSTGEIAKAIESAPSDSVIVLPNNSNVLMSARKAAERSTKTVRVLPTKSIPLGVTASLAYNPDSTIDANYEAMNEAISEVMTIEITRAVRDAVVDGMEIHKDQYMGILDLRLAVTGVDPSQTLLDALEELGAADKELLTIYFGSDIAPNEQQRIAEEVQTRLPDLEVDAHDGGQPHYQILASLE